MASLVAQLLKNLLAMQETLVRFLGGKDPLEKIGYPFQNSPSSQVADTKKYTCNARHLGSIPGWGRSPGGGHGNPLQ